MQSQPELEDIATEALKNLLCVLLNTKVLGFVTAKGGAAEPSPKGDVPVWWQMTWDCIEVFLPGFGDDFSKSMMPQSPKDEATVVGTTAATPLCAVAPAASATVLVAATQAATSDAVEHQAAAASATVLDAATQVATSHAVEDQAVVESSPAAINGGDGAAQAEVVAEADLR